MDIKEIFGQIEGKLDDPEFKEALKENPVQAVEKLIGVDLPDEQVEAVVAFVKEKANLEGILDNAKDFIGGLFSKK